MRNVKRFVLAMFLANTVAVGELAAEEGEQGPPGQGKSPKAQSDKSEKGRDTATKAKAERRKDPAASRVPGSGSETRTSKASALERAASAPGGSEQGASERGDAMDDSSRMDDDASKRRRHQLGPGRDPGIDALEVRSWGLRKKMAQLAKSKDSQAREALQQERSKLREELQQARRNDMKKRWGKLLAKDPALAATKIHARRMARLNRARILAEAHDKDKIITRIDELIAKERSRHQSRMQDLAKTGGAGTIPAATTPKVATPDSAGNATASDGLGATTGSPTGTTTGSSSGTTSGSKTSGSTIDVPTTGSTPSDGKTGSKTTTTGGNEAQEGAVQ